MTGSQKCQRCLFEALITGLVANCSQVFLFSLRGGEEREVKLVTQGRDLKVANENVHVGVQECLEKALVFVSFLSSKDILLPIGYLLMAT